MALISSRLIGRTQEIYPLNRVAASKPNEPDVAGMGMQREDARIGRDHLRQLAAIIDDDTLELRRGAVSNAAIAT